MGEHHHHHHRKDGASRFRDRSLRAIQMRHLMEKWLKIILLVVAVILLIVVFVLYTSH